MNVFEDLITELKQENLLERTIIDDTVADPAVSFELEDSISPDKEEFLVERNSDTPDPAHLEENANVPAAVPMAVAAAADHIPSKPKNGQEFYRKRAMAEVSSLQMVEHVLTGVEREYLKVVPKAYDDFATKKALNTFLQVTENENSAQHQEAEFKLMTETEAWCTALADRDRAVSVANLRQYCENSRPPLSSQALVALAKFYRNLPYSSSVRSKFDFVITRLFSRPSEGELRVPVFSPEETLTHIHTLYRDWSSIALYGAGDDDSQISLAALSFEDLAVEAENASTFDQLVENDFFGRVRSFKEAIGELFYAPNVLASAINANIRVGNAYVRLIALEREKLDEKSLHTKYGEFEDEVVAEGVGRTIELLDLLKSPLNRGASGRPDESPTDHAIHSSKDPGRRPKTEEAIAAGARPRPAFVEKVIESALGMNRWLVGTCAVLVALSVGIYIYANYVGAESVKDTGVRELAIDDPVFKDYVTSGRVTDQTFYGVLLPNWDAIPKERKQDILTKMQQAGKDKGYSQVNLLTEDGKSAGFASATRVEVFK